MLKSFVPSVVVLCGVLSSAWAADPVTTCQVAKLNAVGKKAACLAREEVKAVLGKPANPDKCGVAFIKAFAKAEATAANAGGACPVTGDAEAIEHLLDVTHAGTAQLLAGEGRFLDNGDGTVTDAYTGLMWEKKDNSGGLHDKDNLYNWETATGTWINEVNAEGGTGFAGYNDWRAPTVQELQSIVDYSRFETAIDPVFGLTEPDNYWSSTSDASNSSSAWGVGFRYGRYNTDSKSNDHFVRAVRDGL